MDACAEESSEVRAVSSQCAHAVRDQNVCLGELTCEEFEDWLSETPPESYPRKAAVDAVGIACFKLSTARLLWERTSSMDA